MKKQDDNMLDNMLDKVNEEETNRIEQSFVNVLYEIKKNPGKFKVIIFSSPILAILITSWLFQLIYQITGRQDKLYIVELFTAWLTPLGVIFVLLFTYLLMMGQYKLHMLLKKDYYMDREGNFEISKSGVHGNAHWQTEKERDECFERSIYYDDIKGDILGIDDNDRLYSLRQDLVGINRNKCIFGTPGSGKSAAIIENDIIKCIERGESAIITDSKGDLYRKLSQTAINNGYIVRVLNLKSNELKNSDSFHLLKYLENGDTSVAEVLANAIIEMSGNGHMDYWAKNELNGYKALLLYIATNETFKKTKENNLAKMYEMCTTYNPAQLEVLFDALDNTHPAKQAYNIYANCEPKIQGQILNGMGINLSFLIDNNAKEIVSHDEIDLILPMKQKCMYFVVIPDTNKAYNVIANLFFNMMLIKQCEYSDSLSAEKKEKQIFVNYILDEFKATGAINNFDGVITTIRSRKVGMTCVLQTLGQLMDMYPGNAYDTILGSMTIKILLRAGDEQTARYFSVLCGKQTRRVSNGRYNQSVTDSLPLHNDETKTDGLVGEDLLSIGDAFKIDANDLIVCILGFEPVKLHKYLSFRNPYLQTWDERVPGRHKPLWRKAKEDKAKKKQEEIQELSESTSAKKEDDQKNDAANKPAQNQQPAVENTVSNEPENQNDAGEKVNTETGEIINDNSSNKNESTKEVHEEEKEETTKKEPVKQEVTKEEASNVATSPNPNFKKPPEKIGKFKKVERK